MLIFLQVGRQRGRGRRDMAQQRRLSTAPWSLCSRGLEARTFFGVCLFTCTYLCECVHICIGTVLWCTIEFEEHLWVLGSLLSCGFGRFNSGSQAPLPAESSGRLAHFLSVLGSRSVALPMPGKRSPPGLYSQPSEEDERLWATTCRLWGELFVCLGYRLTM